MTEGIPEDRKLGYKVTLEKVEIREELKARGLSGHELYFAVEKEYARRHANDETYADVSRRLASKRERCGHFLMLTQEEADHLMELFKHANHPISRQVYKKLRGEQIRESA